MTMSSAYQVRACGRTAVDSRLKSEAYAAVQHRVVRQLAGGAEPDRLLRRPYFGPEGVPRLHRLELDRQFARHRVEHAV
jgi:hypothetical protein